MRRKNLCCIFVGSFRLDNNVSKSQYVQMKTAQLPHYFYYNGRLLTDIYDETYTSVDE